MRMDVFIISHDRHGAEYLKKQQEDPFYDMDLKNAGW